MKNDRFPIGIWEPGTVNGQAAFMRPEPLPLGDHYADRRVILQAKKAGCRRVCFFGESVAAGYLYAPHLTPARVLGEHLLHVAGAGRYEVVDLAKTNETLDGLATVVEASLQLEPDVLVIFTGNNWTMLETPELSPYVPSAAMRRAYARLWREGGADGVSETAARRVLEHAAAVFARVAAVARRAGARVVVVIPEVNLGDWQNRQAPRWLPGDGTARWYALYETALGQLRNQAWTEAIETAWQMEALDGCSCPSTYRLLAKAFLGQGREQEARAACQAEVDNNRYATLCFLGAPQIHSGYQTMQKRLSGTYGFATVDLPEIFARHTGSRLPGRHLFLDYCHLTSEGIHVAMAAVAAEILADGKACAADWTVLTASLPRPFISREADAAAKFGAAIHTAHRHLAVGDDGTEILEYWCRASLDASAGVLTAMTDFCEARRAPVPAVLTAALGRNFDSPYRLSMQQGIKYDYLDAPMLRVIGKVLGPEAAAPLYWPEEGIELAYPGFFLWDPVERFYPAAMSSVRDVPNTAFFRAAWPVSSFACHGVPGRAARLEFVLRLPPVPGWDGVRQGVVRVELDGRPVGDIAVDQRWTKAALRVNPDATLQRLTLHWPALPPCGTEAIEGALQRLEQGLEADLHPVFGEVFSIRLIAE